MRCLTSDEGSEKNKEREKDIYRQGKQTGIVTNYQDHRRTDNTDGY